MNVQIPDGLYAIQAVKTVRLLTDLNGAIVVTPSTGVPTAEQTWQVTNTAGGVALRCVGTSRHLSMATRDGFWYLSSAEAEDWRLDKAINRDGVDIVRVASDRRIWLSGMPIEPQPAFLQGVDQDVVPTSWRFNIVD